MLFRTTDWEGYGAERSEILNFIKDQGIKNVIFLTTDLHLNLMNEVFIDLFANASPIAYEVVTGPVGAETDKDRILRLLGPAIGPVFVQARENLLTLVGADCRNIDTYSYGRVTVSQNGIAKIALKDGDKNIIHDDIDPSIDCTKTFGTLGFPKSSAQVNSVKEKSSQIEEIKKVWNDLQGEKSAVTEGRIDLGNAMSGLNLNPFA